MPWFLYILRCADGAFYVGVAQDIEERVRRHNGGDGATFTRVRRPVTLVYTEKYNSYAEARVREIQIKKWGRRKKNELIRSGSSLRAGQQSCAEAPRVRSGQNSKAILAG